MYLNFKYQKKIVLKILLFGIYFKEKLENIFDGKRWYFNVIKKG